jgi:hypothetical protein
MLPLKKPRVPHRTRISRIADRTHLEDLFSISQASAEVGRKTATGGSSQTRERHVWWNREPNMIKHALKNIEQPLWFLPHGLWGFKSRKCMVAGLQSRRSLLLYYLSHLNECFATYLHQIPDKIPFEQVRLSELSDNVPFCPGPTAHPSTPAGAFLKTSSS